MKKCFIIFGLVLGLFATSRAQAVVTIQELLAAPQGQVVDLMRQAVQERGGHQAASQALQALLDQCWAIASRQEGGDIRDAYSRRCSLLGTLLRTHARGYDNNAAEQEALSRVAEDEDDDSCARQLDFGSDSE